MNSRLQQFLELENLTPARLADMLGVQRSGLSHILSGRNKPGYDFIYKLLTRFPAVNAEWLLTGKGKPYKEINNFPPPSGNQYGINNFMQPEEQLPDQKYNHQQYNSQLLINEPIADKPEAISGFSEDFYDQTLFSSVRDNPTKSAGSFLNTDNHSNSSKNNRVEVNEDQINEIRRINMRKEKIVKRVIIFYGDGSFEELFPQK